MIKLFKWFHNNCFEFNTRKFNLITSFISPLEFQIGNTLIFSVNRVKPLGVHITVAIENKII